MSEPLYRSQQMEVRRTSAASNGQYQVVTIQSYHDGNGLDLAGFGEAYFAGEGIDAIHVLCRGNDWYQYAEMPAVTAAIRSAISPTARVMAYGSSMGGYAAIRFAAAIGAHIVLAFSPQYSIDPRVIGADERWIEDQRRIRFLPEVERRIAYAGRIVIAYDPEMASDRLHIDHLATELAIERLPLPFAGHPAGTYLLETGLLQPLVRQTLFDELDPAAFVQEAARRARTSATYLTELSATKPPAEAVELARAAVALAPDTAHIHVRMSNRLAAAGDWPSAIAAHRRALELDSSSAFRWSFANALRAARQLDEALAVTRTLQAESPNLARYHRHAADVCIAMGDIAGAMAELSEAIRCAPTDHDHRRLASRLHWRLKRDRWFGWLFPRR